MLRTMTDYAQGRSTVWGFAEREQADQLELDERQTLLERCLNKLDKRTQRILRLRYGLEGDGMLQPEVGKKLGITKQRIQQLEQAGLEKLRTLMSLLQDKI